MVKNKTFFLNGQEYKVDYGITLLDLINYFNYNNSLLILEHNNLICNKVHWPNTYIAENDKIEIITIVGGG